MKKCYLLSFTCFTLLFAAPVFCRAQYGLTITNESYSDLTGATELLYIESQSGYYQYANFIFPVFERNANFNLNSDPVSAGAYISAQGYLAVYESPAYDNTIILQVFDCSALDRVAGISKVYLKIEGMEPNRILKVQWKDLVMGGDPEALVNFQAWLDESNGDISYHFGPNTMAIPAAQGTCGIIVTDNFFTSVLDEINAEGSPSDPDVYEDITDFGLPTLDSIPSNETVYTFHPASSVAVNDMHVATPFTMFPNPCGDHVMINNDSGKSDLSVFDPLGNNVLQCQLKNGMNRLELGTLPTGVYNLVLRSNKEISSQKLIRE